MSIFDNVYFNFYIDQEQMIRATVSETINIGFLWLSSVVGAWKCQFSSSALSFFYFAWKRKKCPSKVKWSFHTVYFHFLAENVSRRLNNFFTLLF